MKNILWRIAIVDRPHLYVSPITAPTRKLAIARAESNHLHNQGIGIPEFTAVKLGRVRPRAPMPIIDRTTGLPVIALDIIDALPRMGEHHAKNA